MSFYKFPVRPHTTSFTSRAVISPAEQWPEGAEGPVTFRSNPTTMTWCATIEQTEEFWPLAKHARRSLQDSHPASHIPEESMERMRQGAVKGCAKSRAAMQGGPRPSRGGRNRVEVRHVIERLGIKAGVVLHSPTWKAERQVVEVDGVALVLYTPTSGRTATVTSLPSDTVTVAAPYLA